MIGNGNGHVNNLLNSTTKLTKGWKIDVSNGKWTKNQNADVVEEKCGKNSWYGWTRHTGVGSISTTLKANLSPTFDKNPLPKFGRLDFGNCWTAGSVRVYLDNKLIGTARPNTPSKIIEFPIPAHDSILTLKDEGLNSHIRFNKFQELVKFGDDIIPTHKITKCKEKVISKD